MAKAHAADLAQFALMARRPETTGGVTVEEATRGAMAALRRMLAAVHAGDGIDSASEASARLAYEPFRKEHDAPMMTVTEARAILKIRNPVTPDIDTGLAEASAEPSIRVWAFHEAPACYRALSGNGGDELWLALLPGRYRNHTPDWIQSGSFAWANVETHELPTGEIVCIGCGA